TYVSEGVVNEIDVTLEALLADQEAWQEASWNGEAYASPYANRIVKLTNLTLEETDDDATSYWVQGESKLEFNPKKWVKLGFEMPANVATLTGIADYDGIWNYSFTIIPTAVEAVASGETIVEVTTMDELKAHAGETIIYKGLEPIVEAGFMGMNSYFMPDSETMLYCELANTLPARFDAKGIYSAEEGMFAVQEFVAIYAFNTVSDLNMFLLTSNPTEEQKAASYEIKSSFVVTYVDGNFGKIYAQYEGKDPYMGRPMTCGIELGWGGIAPRSGEAIANPGMLAAGDEILVSGVYSPAQYDEEGNLTAAEAFVANTITRVSQNNALEATALSAIEEGTYSYVSGYVMINNVAVAAHETIPGAWTITDSYNGSITVTQCGPNTNLTEYVGKTLDKYLVGVLAYQPAVGGYIFYAIEIKESKEYFDNIAALVATGPRSGGLSTALRNPVVVNYIYYDQWGGYTLFVEDATGVLVVKGIGVMDDEGNYTFPYEVEVGDSILGIDGFIEEGCKMWSGVDYNIDVNLTYVSEGVVNEIDVTLEALLADQEAWQEASWNGEAYASPYANRIVKL
ncbi:MAG: hypothetical protein J6V70_04600, partial [Kiritimatiellae bacterium]|nr:hypothetical protein [Kiritimatiellia bacterium]